MENNLKYFQPDISDIKLGYECELFLNKNGSCEYPEQWVPISIPENAYRKWSLYDGGDQSELDHIISLIDNNQVRTPYLTKEQIEAEGWNYDIEDRDYFKNVNDKSFYTYYNEEERILTIRDRTNSSTINGGFCFSGECKSINEFRTICKLLNIK